MGSGAGLFAGVIVALLFGLLAPLLELDDLAAASNTGLVDVVYATSTLGGLFYVGLGRYFPNGRVVRSLASAGVIGLGTGHFLLAGVSGRLGSGSSVRLEAVLIMGLAGLLVVQTFVAAWRTTMTPEVLGPPWPAWMLVVLLAVVGLLSGRGFVAMGRGLSGSEAFLSIAQLIMVVAAAYMAWGPHQPTGQPLASGAKQRGLVLIGVVAAIGVASLFV